MNGGRTKARAAVGCCLFALAGVGAAGAAGVRINTTPSMPVGLWRVSPSGDLRRGDAVVVCAPDNVATRLGLGRGYIGAGTCPGGTEPLLKVVAAVPGDAVAVGPHGLAVNGAVLADTVPLAHDRAGRALPAWPPGIYTVQPGTAWTTTPAPDSWDSRYWGPVRLADVLGVARPVAVWP